ncbi:MAG: BTAD domain-containing putative transcriptional regulator [Pseudomonadota bacterium]
MQRAQLAAIYARKRLLRTLDDAHKQHRIVWLSGPPGAGKTTLASSYIEARGLPCLWYQIDESDNDVASFFHYFSLAVKAAAPRHRKPLPCLTPDHLPTLKVFARQYFQAVFNRFPHNSAWVFDNYHALQDDSPLHAVLHEVLTDLPPSVSVIAISRNDPPSTLARLRVHNKIALVGAAALKLTPEEATEIARLHDHKRLRPEMIQRIHEQTGGWAAGVVLMLGLDQTELNAAGPTAPQALFDYFASEIFHQMDADTQRILLASALLPTMAASSVELLTGEPRSAEVLADLARRSYFTVNSSQGDATYQYHALFRTFLLRELKTNCPPARLVELQRRAAALLAAEGRVEEAVEVLQTASAWPELAQTIVAAAPMLATQARLQTLAAWINLLPTEFVHDNAWLLYWLAQCQLMINPTEARLHAEKAFALFDQANDPAGLYLSWACVVYTFAVGWQDLRPLDHWLDVFSDIESKYPQIPSTEIAAQVTCSMLVALTHRQPRHPNTERWTQLATSIINAPGERGYRVMLAAYLGIFYTWTGPFIRGKELMILVQPLLTDDLSPMIQILWQCFMGLHSGSRTAHTESLPAAEEARRISRDSGINAMDNVIDLIGIHSCLAAGNVQAAESWLADLDALRDTGQIDYAVYYQCLSLIAIQKGKTRLASEHMHKAIEAAQQHGNMLGEGAEYVGLAQLLFETGHPELAREQLARGWGVSQRIRSELLEYLCWFGQAVDIICYGGDGDWVGPLNALLAREKENDGMGVPLWPLTRVAQVYTFALDHGIEVDYVRSVIRRRNLMPDNPPLDVEHWPWPYRFYTLGRFSIIQDGQPLTLTAKGQKKPLELLKALIAFGGREVSQAQLTAALWPDAEGDAGQQAFEVTLHRLRKMLGEDAPLQLKDGRLTLDARRCWVDVWAFERLLSTLEAGLREHKPDGLDAVAQKLFTLYQGAVLDRESELPATLSLRERLRSRFLRNLKELGRHHESQQAWDRATEYYLRALEVEPLAEEFYQKLMLGYHTLERTAEGLAVYERCKKTLHTSLGVGPSRETEALRQSLVAGRA